MNETTFKPCSEADANTLADFLWSIRDDLRLKDRSTVDKIVERLFAHGGALAGYRDGVMVTMLGYFWGEPEHDFANKEVAFVYVTGIARPYRLSRLFWHGMTYAMHHLKVLGAQEVRCQAAVEDPYTNRLYSHFAERLGEAKSLRGYPTTLYGSSIDNILAYLQRGRQRKQMAAA